LEAAQIALLAFVQGLTEFLPISSSAHLILAPLLFGYELQSLAFDVAVHLGTLAAVVAYFRRELAAMAIALTSSITRRRIDSADARLGWMIVLATLPVLLLGLPLKGCWSFSASDDRLAALVIAGTTIGFGLLLWVADARGRRSRDEYSVRWRDASSSASCRRSPSSPGPRAPGSPSPPGCCSAHPAGGLALLLPALDPDHPDGRGLETLELAGSAGPGRLDSALARRP
jgi:undecaprenyl-diphosphatase